MIAKFAGIVAKKFLIFIPIRIVTTRKDVKQQREFWWNRKLKIEISMKKEYIETIKISQFLITLFIFYSIKHLPTSLKSQPSLPTIKFSSKPVLTPTDCVMRWNQPEQTNVNYLPR